MRKCTTLAEAIDKFSDMMPNMIKKLGNDEAACGYYTALIIRDHDLVEGPGEIYQALCKEFGSAKQRII